MFETVIVLSKKWRICADTMQWIVQRHQGKKPTAGWNPVGFIGSRKDVLLRVLKEEGAVITKKGEKALRKLPPTFLEWRAKN